jgi:hypothetical protein
MRLKKFVSQQTSITDHTKTTTVARAMRFIDKGLKNGLNDKQLQQIALKNTSILRDYRAKMQKTLSNYLTKNTNKSSLFDQTQARLIQFFQNNIKLVRKTAPFGHRFHSTS